MKYALLIYGSEVPDPDAPPDPGLIDEYWKVDKEAQERGALITSQALQESKTATCVRVRNGKTTLTDGPFAETKEHLGGFYLLECRDLDEAIEWAVKIPGSRTGTVEIRPVMEFEAPDWMKD